MVRFHTKQGSDRIVPLFPMAAGVLEKRRSHRTRENPEEPVFLGPSAPMDDCMTLPVCTDGKLYLSRWMPNKEDLEALNRGKPLWLFVWGGQPPVSIETENPFVDVQASADGAK